jgi:hypothetical protein
MTGPREVERTEQTSVNFSAKKALSDGGEAVCLHCCTASLLSGRQDKSRCAALHPRAFGRPRLSEADEVTCTD